MFGIKLFSLGLGQRLRFLSSTLKLNTSWMLLGNGGRLLFQAAYFILIARNLGPQQYGAFIAVVAVAAIASPFIGNGGASLMIKHAARDKSQLPTALGNLLLVTLVSGLLLCALLVPSCIILLPRVISPLAIGLILASDLLVVPYVSVAAAAFWSMERLKWTAALNAMVTLMRLSGIVAIVLLHRPTLMAWSITYLATAALSSLVGLACAFWFLGRPELDLKRVRSELREGFYFSASLAAQTVYNDIDKTMLARLNTLEAVGIYGAAYRLIDVAFVPVSSLLAAAYPGFFRCGKDGLSASMDYGCRLLKRILPYSVFALIALCVAAPILPLVLGRQYDQVVQALRWLAILPLLKTLHYFVADSLTGAGFQGLRTLVQLGVAAFNVLINLWLIPSHGWRGAAWSSIASDGLLALALWLTAAYLTRRTRSRWTQAGPTAVGGQPSQ